jgi:methylase of polypeptide subunit release factors
MELGSGTGFGGIALFVLSQRAKCTPKEHVLTDADPTALELCRWNCDINTRLYGLPAVNGKYQVYCSFEESLSSVWDGHQQCLAMPL